MEEVRSDIAHTRAQMSSTLASLEARVSGKAQAVRESVDPRELARAHPWPALAIALGAGVALSATGADRRAAAATAAATVAAGRRAPDAAKWASHKAADVAHDVVHRDAGLTGDAMASGSPGGTKRESRGGPLGRITRSVRDAVDTRLAELVQDMWRASNDLTAAARANGGVGGRSVQPAGSKTRV